MPSSAAGMCLAQGQHYTIPVIVWESCFSCFIDPLFKKWLFQQTLNRPGGADLLILRPVRRTLLLKTERTSSTGCEEC